MTSECVLCEFELEVIKDIVHDTNKFMKWLREHRVIKSKLDCPQCLLPCSQSGNRFHCTQRCLRNIDGRRVIKKCPFSQSLKTGTWFFQSNLPMEKIFELTLFWAYENRTQTFFESNQQLSRRSAVRWGFYLKEVCTKWCESRSERIGGTDVKMDLDVTKFRRKLSMGWVVGGYERNSTRFFVVIISRCNADTLLEVVRQWVIPGTTIYSECWKTHNCRDHRGYQHMTEDYRINFINRSAHQMSNYYGHLCEYLWRRSVPYLQRAHSIFTIISEQYNKFDK